jgi:hypothetical protein
MFSWSVDRKRAGEKERKKRDKIKGSSRSSSRTEFI